MTDDEWRDFREKTEEAQRRGDRMGWTMIWITLALLVMYIIGVHMGWWIL